VIPARQPSRRPANVEFDAPYLKKSMQLAGLSPSQISVQKRPGQRRPPSSSDAQSAITKGASVLVVDGIDFRGRGEDRELRQGPRGSGGRLRPASLSAAAASTTSASTTSRVGAPHGPGPWSAASRPGRWPSPQVHGHARRPDRQQRHAVRHRLLRGAEPALQERHVQGRHQPGRDVGSAHRADRVPGGVHGAPRTSTPC